MFRFNHLWKEEFERWPKRYRISSLKKHLGSMLMLSTFGGIGVRLFSNHGRMKVEQYGNFAEGAGRFNFFLFYFTFHILGELVEK